MNLTTYSFGIPNLLAFGDETKYFPEQFIKDIFPGLRADEIVNQIVLSGVSSDGDIMCRLYEDGKFVKYYANIKRNIFEKLGE